MQATARRLSVVSATSCARRRLIRDVRPRKHVNPHLPNTMPLRTSNRIIVPIAQPTVGAGPLNVPMIKQEQTQWCWAGCADMALHYYGNSGVNQCDLANWLFSQSACCQIPSSSLCNKPCQVPDVSRVYSAFGLRSTYNGGSVAFFSLETEVAGGRPVEVGYAWTGGGGHVALVVQTGFINGNQAVRVNDPAYGSGGVLYSDLLTAYGQGSWNWTWTGIQR